MFLLSSKPLLYGKFTKYLNGLLKQLGLSTDNISHSCRRGGSGFALQMGIPGEMITLMDDWGSGCYQKYIDVSLQLRTQVMSTFAESLPTSY